MNPYQRIIKDGSVLQNGSIDTETKFNELTQGVDFYDKTVLDVGCNLGMMTEYSRLRGARYSKGIDIEHEFIRDASRLWPKCSFEVGTIYRIPSVYDIILVSAMFHYVTDPSKALSMLARAGRLVLGDFNFYCGKCCDSENAFFMDHRGLWIPTQAGFETLARQHFGAVECRGEAISPDNSTRYYYSLSSPKPSQKTAELVWGVSESGKSTYANNKGLVTGADVLSTDLVFVEWRVINRGSIMDISALSEAYRGKRKDAYVAFYLDYFDRWLRARYTMDVIIEGFELGYEDVRLPLIQRLKDLGWVVKETPLTPGCWK